MLSYLGSAFQLLLVIVGFGLIIFFHELGHFLAARWAKIRVLAFAIGFGPAAWSWRKGMGLRKGSSAAEYLQIAKERGIAVSADAPPVVPGISPTEYRLNVLPFGGYVKMLGQDDADPAARSGASDSYQSAPVWKRMVVISAGVVMNFLLAAVLLVIVFMVGLRTEPAVIGPVDPTGPAATAVASNAKALGVTEPGLQTGDRVLLIDGEKPYEFSDIMVATAMARKGSPVRFVVERDGVKEPLTFDVVPSVDLVSKLLQIGVAPAMSGTIVKGATADDKERLRRELDRAGLRGVPEGSTLVAMEGVERARGIHDLQVKAERSGGAAFGATFQTPTGERKEVRIEPRRRLQHQRFDAGDRVVDARHVLGLLPLLKVDGVQEKSAASVAGMQEGDVFAQLGSSERPSVPEGVGQVKSNPSGTVRVIVERRVDGAVREVDLGSVGVSKDGTIGFFPAEAVEDARVTAWPGELAHSSGAEGDTPTGAKLGLMRGTRILKVAGKDVGTFQEIAGALVEATREAKQSGAASAKVALSVQLPVAGGGSGAAAQEVVEWAIPRAEIEKLHAMEWESPLMAGLFEMDQFMLVAKNPGEAIAMGLRRTHRVMMQTYLTFSRLFEGSVKVEHLKGPVGIAHLGTMVASRGFVHLLFFLALISVNLGVVNFLPIPIADGGHFVFLVYEQITGKPVSVAVQNIATLAGLILIASVFLLVTYNDIANVFR